MLKIIWIEPLGFCFGVRRAIERAREIKSKISGPVYTDGPLIHNWQVLEALEKEGIVAKEIKDTFCPENASAILIRAHGISPDRHCWLKTWCHSHNCSLVDATCPHVARTADLVQHYSRKGYIIFLLGDPEHAEIQGLKAHAKTSCFVFQDMPSLDHFLNNVEKNTLAQPHLLTSQSTLDVNFLEQAARYLSKKLPQLIIRNTICSATRQRQQSLRNALRLGVDAILVIGGKNSANTRRLVAIAQASHTSTYHIENEKEINLETLRSVQKLGICSGTSASEENIQKIVDFLRKKFSNF
ncbi:MAG: 4-hydroxy-3-methylbut-2-enyl diphosphate reductase [Puniceicoccales bacterium]|jgi:4-hydroxy-3-methylbut-2-enyl diphosphate reductase|nr:4-hydroxy-3-methylbut-2-enyl diphosphate reductase [Puniceicoccales bacterium]